MVRMIFHFSRPFPQLDVSMHSGRLLAHFGHPWASKWLTFGSPWLTFGTLWLPFGSLWLTFSIVFEEIKFFSHGGHKQGNAAPVNNQIGHSQVLYDAGFPIKSCNTDTARSRPHNSVTKEE